ncbi:unnamed protein product [Agarophyton chilense]
MEREVYIYNDDGSSDRCVAALQHALRHDLHYAAARIRTTNAHKLQRNLSVQSPHRTALLLPGGRDVPYTQRINAATVEQLRGAIHHGASFTGICAGAYWASSAVHFETRDAALRVVGARMGLVRAPAVGALRAGFEYDSERGASVEIVNVHATSTSRAFRANLYCNGAPGWAAATVRADGDVVVATYATATLQRHGGGDAAVAAVVASRAAADAGGAAVLCGPHVELPAASVSRRPSALRAVARAANLL